MKGFILDGSEYPIIKISSTGEDSTVESVNELNRRFIELVDQNSGKFVTFFDATKSKWASGEVRIAMGKNTKRIEEIYAGRLMRSYVIVPNAIVKMMLKGVNLASKSQTKQEVYSTYDTGYAAVCKFVAEFE